MTSILITGAAGRIGTAITPLLRAAGHPLRLLDRVAPAAASAADDVLQGSVTDQTLLDEAVGGVDLLVHLASHASERPWRDLVDLNLQSAYVVLEAARRAHTSVTVLASSIHAVGFTPSDAAGDRIVAPRPDSLYGVTKVVGEALGSVYADRFGMTVVSARIGHFNAYPHTPAALGTWLSPADFVRLLLAARTAPPGHHIVWGVSANTRCPVSLEAGRSIGYQPLDDAEDHLADLASALGYDDPSELPPLGSAPLGSVFTDADHPLGEAW